MGERKERKKKSEARDENYVQQCGGGYQVLPSAAT